MINIQKKNSQDSFTNELVLVQEIKETNLFIKHLLNILLFLGSFSFLIVGLNSYFQIQLLGLFYSSQIVFFPQGIIMSFYGLCGLLISVNQTRLILIKAGEGYNEFNKEKGFMKLYRKGTSGKNSDINITYSLNDILCS